MTETRLEATIDEHLDYVLPLRSFSERERRVLQLVCQGLSNKEIAIRIGEKEAKIKAIVSGILKGLGVKSRTQAVLRVCQPGTALPDRHEDATLRTPDFRLVHLDARESTARRLLSLTVRELDVLHMVNQGLSNKEAAFRLGVCEGTIKAHMGEILRKLGVHSRTRLVFELSKLQTAADESKPV